MEHRTEERATAAAGTDVRSEMGGRPAAGRRPNEISFVELIAVLLRWLPLVIGAPLFGAFVFGLMAVLSRPDYTAAVSFIPQSQQTQEQGGGLLARLGLGGGSSESPTFYAALLETRGILLATADYELRFERDGEAFEGTVAELFQVGEGPATRRRTAVMHLMEEIIEVEPTGTGIVRLEVTTPWPEASERIAARLLELLAEFNMERRKSQAGEERRFAEQQMAEARNQLRAAEDSLKEFLRQNRRGYDTSPELALERARMEREIEHRQAIFSQLVQGYYQARLDEVRNTPVLTIVEPPERSAIRNPRYVVRRTLIGGLAGLGIGVLGALLLQFLADARKSGREDVVEMVARGERVLVRLRDVRARLARRHG